MISGLRRGYLLQRQRLERENIIHLYRYNSSDVAWMQRLRWL
jgi:hypothetical protein